MQPKSWVDGVTYDVCRYPDAAMYWLCAYRDGQMEFCDGPHDDPEGVAEAMELTMRLGFSRPDTVYRMVMVADVPAYEADTINQESVDIMRAVMSRTGNDQPTAEGGRLGRMG